MPVLPVFYDYILHRRYCQNWYVVLHRYCSTGHTGKSPSTDVVPLQCRSNSAVCPLCCLRNRVAQLGRTSTVVSGESRLPLIGPVLLAGTHRHYRGTTAVLYYMTVPIYSQPRTVFSYSSIDSVLFYLDKLRTLSKLRIDDVNTDGVLEGGLDTANTGGFAADSTAHPASTRSTADIFH